MFCILFPLSIFLVNGLTETLGTETTTAVPTSTVPTSTVPTSTVPTSTVPTSPVSTTKAGEISNSTTDQNQTKSAITTSAPSPQTTTTAPPTVNTNSRRVTISFTFPAADLTKVTNKTTLESVIKTKMAKLMNIEESRIVSITLTSGSIKVTADIASGPTNSSNPATAAETFKDELAKGNMKLTYESLTLTADAKTFTVAVSQDKLTCYVCNGTKECSGMQSTSSPSQACSNGNQFCATLTEKNSAGYFTTRACKEMTCTTDKENVPMCETKSGITKCDTCCSTNKCNSPQVPDSSSNLFFKSFNIVTYFLIMVIVSRLQ